MDPLNEDVLLAMEDMGLDKERTLQVSVNEWRTRWGVALLPLSCLFHYSFFLGTWIFLFSSRSSSSAPVWALEGRRFGLLMLLLKGFWSLTCHITQVFCSFPFSLGSH